MFLRFPYELASLFVRRHITKGRVRFRRVGEVASSQYTYWKKHAMKFTAQRIKRDQARLELAKDLKA